MLASNQVRTIDEQGLFTATSFNSAIVLDSSFNPPTNAHLALLEASIGRSRSVSQGPLMVILSLSLTHVDKSSISSSHEIAQRELWLSALTKQIAHSHSVHAFAIIFKSAKLFVEKRRVLKDLLPNLRELIFLMGDDTLRRFLSPSYYPSLSGTGLSQEFGDFFGDSKIYAAQRDVVGYLEKVINTWLSKNFDTPLYSLIARGIHYLELPKEVRAMSSTLVRSLLESPSSMEELEQRTLQQLLPYCIYSLIVKSNFKS